MDRILRMVEERARSMETMEIEIKQSQEENEGRYRHLQDNGRKQEDTCRRMMEECDKVLELMQGVCCVDEAVVPCRSTTAVPKVSPSPPN